ncbi:MAG: rSAM-modified peptide [Bacteroidetes bacterium]|nr:MAG: rSAM-modified peptide [Bacteroidota bacterium]
MKSLKLNKINRNQLTAKQMNAVTGGGSCGCSCYWAGQNGSSTIDNGIENWKGRMSSLQGDNAFQICCAP